MNIRRLPTAAAVLIAGWLAVAQAPCAFAQAEPPDALVKRASSDVLATIQADSSIQAGDINKIVALVDTKILPYFDFEKMTASAAGPHWKDATADQKKALEEQFKILLIRVYSGALSQARGRSIELKPTRDPGTADSAVVRTQVTGRGDPIELDFRLAREDASWKIYDMNVGGVWLVDNYRSTFSQEIANGGIDNLIAKLSEKNKAARG
jgi:phospholipid transport system substrate-binding protein